MRICRCVTLSGGVLSTGGRKGAATFTTVTMTLAETSLPDESLALKTTVVAPTLKEDGALLVTGTAPSTASAAVAPLRNEAIWDCVAGTAREPFDETTIGAGADSCGGCVSTTAIVKLAVAEVPSAPTATHVTDV